MAKIRSTGSIFCIPLSTGLIQRVAGTKPARPGSWSARSFRFAVGACWWRLRMGSNGWIFASGRLTPFVSPEAGIVDNRLNDAKCGPDGAIWVGSMRIDASKPTGALYRISTDGAFERKEGGIIVSNGLGWSADGKTFYFVDTVPGLIHAYDCDPATGTLSGCREFARIPVADGRPDGLAVDAEGGVWCAIWDGWSVRRYLPNGKLDQ